MKEKHYIVTYFKFLAICTKGNNDSDGTWYPIVKIIKHDSFLPHYSKEDGRQRAFPSCDNSSFKILSEHDSFEEAMESVYLEVL